MKEVKLTNSQTGNIFLSLSYLMRSGIRTADAFSIIAGDAQDPYEKELLTSMSKASDEGEPLAEVVKKTGVFPDFACAMLDVGEESGRTEEALGAIARICNYRQTLSLKLRSSFLYPSVLMLIMVAVVVMLLVFVLPVFDSAYALLGSSLTGAAGVLLGLGGALKKVLPVLAVIIAALTVFLIAFTCSDTFRDRFINRLIRKSGGKGALGEVRTARFAQALSMCMSSGLNTEKALEASSGLLDDGPLTRRNIENCLELLHSGESLSDALGKSSLLPVSECRILEAGIKGGNGEEAMEEIARRLTEESDNAIDEKISRIEPAMVIISSVMIGAILLSVMLPLVNIMNSIG